MRVMRWLPWLATTGRFPHAEECGGRWALVAAGSGVAAVVVVYRGILLLYSLYSLYPLLCDVLDG